MYEPTPDYERTTVDYFGTAAQPVQPVPDYYIYNEAPAPAPVYQMQQAPPPPFAQHPNAHAAHPIQHQASLPPHHYIPVLPPKPKLLPAFVEEQDYEPHRSTSEHIRQIGVPVLPIVPRPPPSNDQFGYVTPSQNKAYLQHLRNHKNFDTMKNLKSVNDCQICQMFLSEEGQYYEARFSQGYQGDLSIDIPDEPNFDVAAPAPFPVLPQPPRMPSPHQHQMQQNSLEGLPDARYRPRIHVRDIFGDSPQASPVASSSASPQVQPRKLLIPAPDYDTTRRQEEGVNEVVAKAAEQLAKVNVSSKPEVSKERTDSASKSSKKDDSKTQEKEAKRDSKEATEKAAAKKPEVIDARVIKDYKKRGEGDLNVHKGDFVQVLESNGKWCRVRTIEGMVGFVPFKYLLMTSAEKETKKK